MQKEAAAKRYEERYRPSDPDEVRLRKCNEMLDRIYNSSTDF